MIQMASKWKMAMISAYSGHKSMKSFHLAANEGLGLPADCHDHQPLNRCVCTSPNDGAFVFFSVGPVGACRSNACLTI